MWGFIYTNLYVFWGLWSIFSISSRRSVIVWAAKSLFFLFAGRAFFISIIISNVFHRKAMVFGVLFCFLEFLWEDSRFGDLWLITRTVLIVPLSIILSSCTRLIYRLHSSYSLILCSNLIRMAESSGEWSSQMKIKHLNSRLSMFEVEIRLVFIFREIYLQLLYFQIVFLLCWMHCHCHQILW